MGNTVLAYWEPSNQPFRVSRTERSEGRETRSLSPGTLQIKQIGGSHLNEVRVGTYYLGTAQIKEIRGSTA